MRALFVLLSLLFLAAMVLWPFHSLATIAPGIFSPGKDPTHEWRSRFHHVVPCPEEDCRTRLREFPDGTAARKMARRLSLAMTIAT